MNEKIWISDPIMLIKEYDDIKISQKHTFVKNLNNLSKIIIYVTLITFLITRKTTILISGVFSLAVFISIYYLRTNKSKQGFEVSGHSIEESKISKKKLNEFHPITDKNPMGNVLPGDYVENPERKPAPPSYDKTVSDTINTVTKKMLNEKNSSNSKFDQKLFRDLGDNYKFEESMMNFYTTPGSQIPNNQGEFAKFCYGDMPSCKEGNEFACSKKDLRYINY